MKNKTLDSRYHERGRAEAEFLSLNLGEPDNLADIPLDVLVAMTAELKHAQKRGELDLETNAGVEKLAEIVDWYTRE